MNHNHTDLETSRRLARVWPGPPADRRRAWWVGQETVLHPEDVAWELGLDCRWRLDADWPEGGPIAARDLSELEAEIREMGLNIEIIIHDDGAVQTCTGRDPYSPPHMHIINALANAVAEAKEKRAAESQEKP